MSRWLSFDGTGRDGGRSGGEKGAGSVSNPGTPVGLSSGPRHASSRETGTEVTARDLETGESETVTIRNDYVVIVDGQAFVDGVQMFGNGTTVVTIKRRPLGEQS